MGKLLRAFHRSTAKPSVPYNRERKAVYMGGNRVLTTTVHGQPLFVDSRDLSLSPQIILNGTWEPEVTQALSSLVKPGMTIANIGYFTTFLGRLVGPQGCVRAFEANPEIFDLLTENIDINGLIPFVRAEQKLVCDSCGEREITLLERHRGSGSMLSFTDAFVALYRDKKTTIGVPATTLDAYWKDEARSIDLVKMDAEGSEPMILQGMRRIIAQPHLTMVCEFHNQFFETGGPSAEAFLDAILGYGFVLHKITEQGNIAPVSTHALLASDEGAELVFLK